MSGALFHRRGLVAERLVAERYARGGAVLARRRWRGPGGEIDLIVYDGDTVVFVEVKSARDHARAAANLSERQIERIRASAEAYLAAEPDPACDARFDVALVDGAGRVEILPNALA